MKIFTTTIFSLFLFASSVFAEGLNHEQIVLSNFGKNVSLKFSTPEVTSDTPEATLCVNPRTEVLSAKLWMDMGSHSHGSTPTQLVDLGQGCYAIEDINFVMIGQWQIFVTMQDGDKATFNVDVN